MIVFPPLESSERRLSEIDRFCIQTLDASKAEVARRVRFIASIAGFVCLILVVCLGFAVSRASAAEQQRNALVEELRLERAARLEATLAARDVEMSAATQALDTRVQGDIVAERMAEQRRQAAELERRAEEIARQKLIEANCVTPRSVRLATGL